MPVLGSFVIVLSSIKIYRDLVNDTRAYCRVMRAGQRGCLEGARRRARVCVCVCFRCSAAAAKDFAGATAQKMCSASRCVFKTILREKELCSHMFWIIVTCDSRPTSSLPLLVDFYIIFSVYAFRRRLPLPFAQFDTARWTVRVRGVGGG